MYDFPAYVMGNPHGGVAMGNPMGILDGDSAWGIPMGVPHGESRLMGAKAADRKVEDQP